MAAKVLADAGAKVVMIEAGPLWYSESHSAMFQWNYGSPRRGAATPEKHWGEFDGTIGGWTIEGEPYTLALSKTSASGACRHSSRKPANAGTSTP